MLVVAVFEHQNHAQIVQCRGSERENTCPNPNNPKDSAHHLIQIDQNNGYETSEDEPDISIL
jgi:hypothetical protein